MKLVNIFLLNLFLYQNLHSMDRLPKFGSYGNAFVRFSIIAGGSIVSAIGTRLISDYYSKIYKRKQIRISPFINRNEKDK